MTRGLATHVPPARLRRLCAAAQNLRRRNVMVEGFSSRYGEYADCIAYVVMFDHELHYYDYVNRPYREVSETLRMHPREVFASATGAAANRAKDLAASL